MKKSTKPVISIILVILLLELLLIVPGLFWGYNLFGDGQHYVINPDERHHTTIAREFFEGFDYNQFYVRGFGNQIAVVFGLGKFLNSSLELKSQHLYAIGRMLALLYGLASIILIYFFARELFEDQTTALLSSLFLATSWIHVAYSHIAVPDVPTLFWMYLAFYFILRYLKDKNDADLVFASIATGFSIGTKPNIILFVPLFFIVITSPRKFYHGLLVLFTIIGSFELINAFSYTPDSFLNSRYMIQSDSFSGAEVNKLINVPAYLLLLLPSLGLPVCLLSIYGMANQVKNTNWKNLRPNDIITNRYFLIIAPLVLHFYLICSLVVNLTRYLMPLIPLLAVFAAFGLVKLLDRLSPKLFKWVLAAIIVYQLLLVISL